jgi:hypothetical protein
MILSDKRWVSYTPILTTLLLEYANAGQLWRMWHVHSALGQNVWSWLSVNVALWLWLNWYRVFTPQSWAIPATCVGICINGLLIATVFYFRATGRA